MAQKIVKIINRAAFGGCFLGMIILLIMMFMTTVDVIGRKFFDKPVPGSYELTGIMLAVVILLGLGYTQLAEANVRIEFLTSKLPVKVQGYLDVIFKIVVAAFFIVVAWQGIKESTRVMHQGTTSDILRIPSYPFQFLVAVGSILLVLILLVQIGTTVYQLSHGKYVKREMGKEVQQGLN